MTNYEVKWEGVEASVKALCAKIKNPENIDLVVGLARGGVIPARLVANELNVQDSETIKKTDSVNDIFFKLNGYLRILFVDDINDSGKTFSALAQVLQHISLRGQYQVASLYQRHNTKFKDAPYGIMVDTNDWLVFPWENEHEIQKDNSRTGLR
jgi:hypoxanthine phosphoribosyltransferase